MQRRQHQRQHHQQQRQHLKNKKNSQRQQQYRDCQRGIRDAHTPEQLEVIRQQNRVSQRRIRDAYTPEQLEVTRQQKRVLQRTIRDAYTPEQLEVARQQNCDCQRRIREASYHDRISQSDSDNSDDEEEQVNASLSVEQFSIDMISRPTVNQLANFESDQDQALLLFYDNSNDHFADAIYDMDAAAPGEAATIAEQLVNDLIEGSKITPEIQRIIQQRFQSIHDSNGHIIGCCSCGVSSILPTVTVTGENCQPPLLRVFPTDPLFGPLKFTDDELVEFDLQTPNKQLVRSTKLSQSGEERYHLHQELLTVNTSCITEGYICTKCENDLSRGIIPTYSVAKLDFGLASRVNLPELFPIEKLLIARHRQLAVTIKLSPGGSEPDGYTGHLITFVHQGPETIINSSGGTPEARRSLLWSFCVSQSVTPPVLTRGGFNLPKRKSRQNKPTQQTDESWDTPKANRRKPQ